MCVEHSNVSSCGFTGAVFEDVAAGQHVPHAEEQQSLLDVLGPYSECIPHTALA